MQNNRQLYQLENYWDQFNNVDSCFFAYYKGQFSHLNWVYFECNKNNFLSIKSKESIIGSSYTVNEIRSKGIYLKVILKICNYLKNKDFKRVFMLVSKNNKSIIQKYKKNRF